MKKKIMSRFGKIIATSIATQLLFFNITFTNTVNANELISKESTIIKEVPSPEVDHIGQVKEERVVTLKPLSETVPQVVQQEPTISTETTTIQPVTETTEETSVEPTTIPSTIETTQETEATTSLEMTTVPEMGKSFDILNPDPDLIYFVRSTIIFPEKPELKLWEVPSVAPTRDALSEYTGKITKVLTTVKSTLMFTPKPEYIGSLVPAEAPTREALPEYTGSLVPAEAPIREALPEYTGSLVPAEVPKRKALPEYIGSLVPVEAPTREALPEYTGSLVVTTKENMVTTVNKATSEIRAVETTSLENILESSIETIQNMIEEDNPIFPQEAQANEVESSFAPEVNSENDSNSQSQAEGESPSSESQNNESSAEAGVPSITHLRSGELVTTVVVLAVLVIAAGLILFRV